jgi:hypothetical protein
VPSGTPCRGVVGPHNPEILKPGAAFAHSARSPFVPIAVAKQEAFALAYLETGNEAYRRAYDAGGMKPASVNREASVLLDNPKITTRLEGAAGRRAQAPRGQGSTSW